MAAEWKVQEQVTRIEEKIDTLVSQGGDHETRLRLGESFRHRAYGVMAALATLKGFLLYGAK